MKKSLALLVALVLVSGAIASMASAAADVQKLAPYPFASPLDPDASGKAVVNQSMGKVVMEITVSAKGLEPEAEYTVYIGDTGSWMQLGTFTTNKNGNGHFHVNYREGDTLPGNLDHIAVNNADNQTVLIDEDF